MSIAVRVKMYSMRGCGYCSAARRLLAAKGVEFEDIDIRQQTGLRQEMEQLSGGQTVPQIFINDSPVGGYDDIAALDVNGELDKLLAGQSDS
jgi:glutaredoxin 3